MRAFLFVLFVAFACATISDRFFPEYSEVLTPDAGWEVDHSGDASLVSFSYMVALTQRNMASFSRLAERLSDPRHPHYGRYLTLEQVRDRVAPLKKNVDAVRSFFLSHNVSRVILSASGDWMEVRATPAQINAALNTDIRMWRSKNADSMGKTTWRSVVPYSFPSHLQGMVDYVSNIHHFPKPRKGKFYSPKDAPLIGPTQLRTRYNISDWAPATGNNTQAVAEFQGQYYSPSDLNQFFQQYVPGQKNSSVAGVIGPNNANAPGVEAELDIQYIMGVNPNTKTYFYSQSSFEFWSDLTAWITILNNDPRPPLVHSISYGEQSEHQTSESFKQRFDQEMQKLGSRGLSIIFASGDSGSGCFLCFRFTPSFPATSPHVTSVGATQFISGGAPITPGTPEAAVSQFGSGGGFSWTFPRPSYQAAAVNAYITNHTSDIPAQFHWNKNGRATPDVAALGIGFAVVVSGGVESIGGTSAAAPTFAAVISTLNAQQQLRGRPPLGFLNPWLYQTWAKAGNAFYDVTQGNNADGCCVHGFKCAPGYDAVTGLGTPNYPVLKSNLP